MVMAVGIHEHKVDMELDNQKEDMDMALVGVESRRHSIQDMELALDMGQALVQEQAQPLDALASVE